MEISSNLGGGPVSVDGRAFIQTSAGPVPLEQWQQWQTLADKAAAARGAPAGAASGAALHMQLKQWHEQQELLRHPPQVALRGGVAVGSRAMQQPPTRAPDNDPSNAMLHMLLSEAVSKTMGSKPHVAASTGSPRHAAPTRRTASAAGWGLDPPPSAEDGSEEHSARQPRASYTEGFGAGAEEEEDYYPNGDGDDGGGEDGGEDGGDGAVEALFGQVLSLQEQLQQLDTENARLRRQLNDQKGLMQQMQAALLEQEQEPPPGGSGGGGSLGSGGQHRQQQEGSDQEPAAAAGPAPAEAPAAAAAALDSAAYYAPPRAVAPSQAASSSSSSHPGSLVPGGSSTWDQPWDLLPRVACMPSEPVRPPGGGAASWMPDWPAAIAAVPPLLSLSQSQPQGPQQPPSPPEIEMQPRPSLSPSAGGYSQQLPFGGGASARSSLREPEPWAAPPYHQAPQASYYATLPAARPSYGASQAQPGEAARLTTSRAGPTPNQSVRSVALPDHWQPGPQGHPWQEYSHSLTFPRAIPQQVAAAGRQQQAGGGAPAGSKQTLASQSIPVAAPAAWACKVCTYEHAGKEQLFLKCAVCGAMR